MCKTFGAVSESTAADGLLVVGRQQVLRKSRKIWIEV